MNRKPGGAPRRPPLAPADLTVAPPARTGSPLPRRRQAERRAESENRLLAAASALLVESGIGAATFENIGQRAGLSRGLVTRRFGSKRGLIEALIDRLKGRIAEALNARRLDDASGLDAVLAYSEAFLDSLQGDREQRAYFILLAASVADVSELRATFDAPHQTAAKMLQWFLRKGMRDGSVRSDLDPEAAALNVGSLLFGLAMQSLLDPQMDLGRLRATALDMARRSLEA